jgi:hypothetical protein
MDMPRQQMVLATIKGTLMLHYVPFMYFSIKREYQDSEIKEILVIEDLNLYITFS